MHYRRLLKFTIHFFAITYRITSISKPTKNNLDFRNTVDDKFYFFEIFSRFWWLRKNVTLAQSSWCNCRNVVARVTSKSFSRRSVKSATFVSSSATKRDDSRESLTSNSKTSSLSLWWDFFFHFTGVSVSVLKYRSTSASVMGIILSVQVVLPGPKVRISESTLVYG